MEGADVQNVCRLCPENGTKYTLHDVFGNTTEKNLKEIILTTTGIEVLECDLVSRKVCERCCIIIIKMSDFREDAIAHDLLLKKTFSQLVKEKRFDMASKSVTLEKDIRIHKNPVKLKNKSDESDLPLKSLKCINKLHPSVKEIYRNNPNITIPNACKNAHLNPVVSLKMEELDLESLSVKNSNQSSVEENSPNLHNKKTMNPVVLLEYEKVEKYFKDRKLDMNKFIYKKTRQRRSISERKQTTLRSKKLKLVTPIRISKIHVNSNEANQINTIYVCVKTRKTVDNSASPILPLDDVSTKTSDRKQENESLCTNKCISEEPKIDSKQLEILESVGLRRKSITEQSQRLPSSSSLLTCQLCNNSHKNECKAKKFSNLTNLSIPLERVHLNLDIRKQYKDAFSNFESIPGLFEPEESSTLITLPPQARKEDSPNIRDLSNQDDSHLKSHETPSINYTSVSVVKPEIRIRNNTFSKSLGKILDDRHFMKTLIKYRHFKKSIEEKTLSDTVSNKDIIVNYSEETCKLVNLRNQVSTNYKIPVQMQEGEFQMTLHFKSELIGRVNNKAATSKDLTEQPLVNETDLILNSEIASESLEQSKSSTVNSSVSVISDNSISSSDFPQSMSKCIPLKKTDLNLDLTKKPKNASSDLEVRPGLLELEVDSIITTSSNPEKDSVNTTIHSSHSNSRLESHQLVISDFSQNVSAMPGSNSTVSNLTVLPSGSNKLSVLSRNSLGTNANSRIYNVVPFVSSTTTANFNISQNSGPSNSYRGYSFQSPMLNLTSRTPYARDPRFHSRMRKTSDPIVVPKAAQSISPLASVSDTTATATKSNSLVFKLPLPPNTNSQTSLNPSGLNYTTNTNTLTTHKDSNTAVPPLVFISHDQPGASPLQYSIPGTTSNTNKVGTYRPSRTFPNSISNSVSTTKHSSSSIPPSLVWSNLPTTAHFQVSSNPLPRRNTNFDKINSNFANTSLQSFNNATRNLSTPLLRNALNPVSRNFERTMPMSRQFFGSSYSNRLPRPANINSTSSLYPSNTNPNNINFTYSRVPNSKNENVSNVIQDRVLNTNYQETNRFDTQTVPEGTQAQVNQVQFHQNNISVSQPETSASQGQSIKLRVRDVRELQ